MDFARQHSRGPRSRGARRILAALLLAGLARAAYAGTPATAGSRSTSEASPAPAWTGWFFGTQVGEAWGRSAWTASGPAGAPVSGDLSLSQRVDFFNQSGSFFGGFHAGYDRMLASGLVLGGEAQVSFPSFRNLAGFSLGGAASLPAPAGATERYGENLLYFGSLRGRIGFTPGGVLVFAAGGLAFGYDELTLTPSASRSPLLLRLGWNLGAGIEMPIGERWTAGLEYSFTRFAGRAALFPGARQRLTSDLTLQELQLALSYRFGGASGAAALSPWIESVADRIAIHGQATFSYQGNAAFRSPYAGPNSLPGSAEGREITDASLFAGVRLWRGAELWADPAVDQGFGLANTHGVAGFTSAEAYKFGAHYPYAVLQRLFIRQTFDLGGGEQPVDAGSDWFAGRQSANRLVLTLGNFAINDLFDTNDYANDPKRDFLNWSLINAGTFDYAGNAWGYTDGLALEWYQGRYALRAGVFDLSATPAGGDSPTAYGLDATFRQFQWVAELEERHRLWGEPGTFKITGFLSRGRAGRFRDALALAAVTGQPADINAVRRYTSRPGVSINLQQQVTADVGVFARAGWADGSVEPWDFADIDRTVSAGVSLSGSAWRRPRDTVGIGAVVNGISGVHQAFLDAGGLGLLVGDGKLPHPGLEKILESYYSYALLASTRLSFDYQLIDDPAYNADRGPVNVFAVRLHWQF